jgi:hypothetical protein
MLEGRMNELEQRPSEEGKLRRELRKAEYEIVKSRKKMDELRAACMAVAEPVEQGPASQPAEPDYGSKGLCTMLSQRLKGLQIAVIGGLTRLKERYREALEQQGCTFFYHDGVCKGGTGRIRHIAAAADIVVFITTVNSHNALEAVRTACRKSSKNIVITDRTGPCALVDAVSKAVLAERGQI